MIEVVSNQKQMLQALSKFEIPLLLKIPDYKSNKFTVGNRMTRNLAEM